VAAAEGGVTGAPRRIAPELVALLAGALLWEAAGRLLDFAFLPPLSDVLRAGARLLAAGELLPALARSLASLLAGYALAAGAGLAMGAAMGRWPAAEQALGFYVDGLLAAPSLVFVPILFSTFGTARATQVAVVVLYALPVIAATTAAAVRGVDGQLVEMARAFGAAEASVLRTVVLPAALPHAMAGLRVGMARAVKGMVSGEMLVALTGLGAALRTHGSRFDAPAALAVLLVVVALALGATGLLRWTDARLNAWARLEAPAWRAGRA
jgi:NitT/TauT family transport system permease protein